MDKLLMGIDVGTTGAKAAIYNLNGNLQAEGHAEYEVSIPHPGWAEQDPEIWWNAVCHATQHALKMIPVGPENVKGVAVSSQAPSMLALNKNNEPVRPALIWMDRRAEKEAQFLKDRMGEGIIEKITGNRPDPFYVASKLLWFKTHEPELFAQTSCFIQANGFINYKLTNQLSLDNVHATLLQLRKYNEGGWSEELCKLCDVDPDKFPPIFEGYEMLGEVTKEASRLTGLHEGTAVMAGTVDGAAAAMEAGAVEQGIVAEMTGTSSVLLIPEKTGIIETAFIAMPHALSDMHLLLGALVSTGASLKWFRDQLGEAEMRQSKLLDINPYDLLTQQAEHKKPGSGGLIFLPYMMGERSPVWNTNARGVFFGLSLGTSKGDMIRAILEGTSFALYHNLKIAEQAGITINEIRSVGGGTKSRLWNQIKADVLGIPVIIPDTSIGAPLGDALLAGMGLGLFKDIKQSIREMFHVREIFEPDMENHKLYNEYFKIYKAIYENLRNEFENMVSIKNNNF